MTARLCRITGILRSAGGEPLADTPVLIRPRAITASVDGAALPRVEKGRSDADGVLILNLLPAHYHLLWSDGRKTHAIPLSVPDEDVADLADLLVEAPIPVRGPMGKGWSRGYFDYTTGRVVFESDTDPELGFQTDDLRGAGAALPPGIAGQLVGYGAGGVPVAMDAPAPKLSSQQW